MFFLCSSSKRKEDLYLGFLTKQHLIMISVAVGLVILVIIITVAAVLATKPGTYKLFAIYESLKCSDDFGRIVRIKHQTRDVH